MALAQLDLFEGRFPEASVEFEKHGDETYQQMAEAIVEYSLGHEKKSQQAARVADRNARREFRL